MVDRWKRNVSHVAGTEFLLTLLTDVNYVLRDGTVFQCRQNEGTRI